MESSLQPEFGVFRKVETVSQWVAISIWFAGVKIG